MNIVHLLINIVQGYLAIGLLFAILFVLKGVTRIDEGAVGSGWGFRVIIIPGTAVFWPLLLRKWWRVGTNKKPRHD